MYILYTTLYILYTSIADVSCCDILRGSGECTGGSGDGGDLLLSFILSNIMFCGSLPEGSSIAQPRVPLYYTTHTHAHSRQFFIEVVSGI